MPWTSARSERGPGFAMKTGALLALLLSAGSMLGCRSPSHERAVGSNTLRLYAAPPTFQGGEEAVLQAATLTLERVASMLEVRNVSVDVAFSSQRAIPGWGVGGYTPGAERVLIWLDPDAGDVPDLLRRRLPWILAHELHHSLRWRDPGYGSTLLQAMVSEGLADHFARRAFGGPPPPWTSALSAEEAAGVHRLAASAASVKPYDHAEWFFGTGSIPRWAGYTLGFEIVARHLESNPSADPITLVSAPAPAFPLPWAAD